MYDMAVEVWEAIVHEISIAVGDEKKIKVRTPFPCMLRSKLGMVGSFSSVLYPVPESII
jgi:hypothetical protein